MPLRTKAVDALFEQSSSRRFCNVGRTDTRQRYIVTYIFGHPRKFIKKHDAMR